MEYKTDDELLQESFEEDYKDMDNIIKTMLIVAGLLLVFIGILVFVVILLIRNI